VDSASLSTRTASIFCLKKVLLEALSGVSALLGGIDFLVTQILVPVVDPFFLRLRENYDGWSPRLMALLVRNPPSTLLCSALCSALSRFQRSASLQDHSSFDLKETVECRVGKSAAACVAVLFIV
jgi:hypothetical protein